MKNTLFRYVITFGRVAVLCVFLGTVYVVLYKWLVPEVPIPYEYVSSNRPQSIKRGVVFAAYDKGGHIPDYVVRYLQELKKTKSDIVFISDNPVFPSEIEKIKNLVLYARFEKHGEYDFGSYKRGVNYLLNNHLLNNDSDLILCNDSVYGPFYPLADIFDQMNQKDIDFWGMVANNEYQYHLQSWFLYFKNTHLIQNDLKVFLNRVKPEKERMNVVKNYEVSLTKYLNQQGYKSDSFISPFFTTLTKKGHVVYLPINSILFFPITLLEKYHFPFLKKAIFPYSSSFAGEPEKCLKYLEKNFPDFYRLVLSDLRERGLYLKEN